LEILPYSLHPSLAVQRGKSALITKKKLLLQKSSGVKAQMNQPAPGCLALVQVSALIQSQ
jgi:hypothetical protein